MTRETKIGIVVAVSFLSLVGLVVVTKYRRGANPSPDLAHNAKPGEPKPVKMPVPEGNPPNKEGPIVQAGGANLRPSQIDSNPPLPLPKSTQETMQPLIVQPNLSNNQTPVPAPLTATASVESNLPQAPNSADERLKSLQAQIKQDTQAALPVLPALPALPNPGATLPLPPPPLPEPVAKVDETIGNAFNKLDETQRKAAQIVDSAITKGNDEINKGVNRVDVAINKGNDFLNQKVDDSIKRANQGIDKANNAANNAVQGGVNKLDALLGKLNNNINKGIDSANKGLDNLDKKLTLPPPAAVQIDVGGRALPPITNSNAAGTNPPPIPMTATQNPFPALPAPQGNEPRPAIPAPTSPLPMLAANNTGNFTIPAPNKTGVEPRVTSDTVRNYQIRGGETFASLSKAYYGSERYANALQAFNRDFNPSVGVNLQPGQIVRVPSEQLLQDRYAGAIAPGLGATTVAGIGAAPVSISPPAPVASSRPLNPPATADPTKSYRVPAQGQFIFDIARQTMGDGNRWSEIYRLNPMVDPTQPIPGNTVLRLPSNANIP